MSEDGIRIFEYQPEKHRYKFEKEHLKVLTQHFEDNPNPGPAIKRQIAKELNIPLHKVQVWFNNRRRIKKTPGPTPKESQRNSPQKKSSSPDRTHNSAPDCFEPSFVFDRNINLNLQVSPPTNGFIHNQFGTNLFANSNQTTNLASNSTQIQPYPQAQAQTEVRRDSQFDSRFSPYNQISRSPLSYIAKGSIIKPKDLIKTLSSSPKFNPQRTPSYGYSSCNYNLRKSNTTSPLSNSTSMFQLRASNPH